MNYISNIYKNFPISYRYVITGAIIGFFIDLMQNFTFHLSMRNDFQYSWFIMSSRFGAFYIIWIILAPVMYRVAVDHTDLFQSGKSQKLWRLLGISLLVSLVHLVLYSLLFDLIIFFKNGVFASWLELGLLIRLGANYFASLVYYLLIMAIFFFHIYLFRYLNKEKELSKAQLNALLMQLRPHFLFNTLHSINTLIDLDAKSAQSMVTKLGGLLRQVIQTDQGHLISFEKELAFIRNYLDIEQIRFQDRLKIDYHIAPESLPAKVPKLILQPIVENTIKHGISKLTDNGVISIQSMVEKRAPSQKEYLILSIKDNGPGISTMPISSNGSGIGLKNVVSRLEQHYANDYVFTMVPYEESTGAHILIKIPFVI